MQMAVSADPPRPGLRRGLQVQRRDRGGFAEDAERLRPASVSLRASAVSAVILAGALAAFPALAQQGTSAWTDFRAADTKAGAALDVGKAVFQNRCFACHGAGSDKPGTLALQAKYGVSKPALLEERTDLTPQTVKFYVRNGVSIMPPFRKTELNDAELDALAAYLSHGKK
jgi:mono/diheme cytochrome c family protein